MREIAIAKFSKKIPLFFAYNKKKKTPWKNRICSLGQKVSFLFETLHTFIVILTISIILGLNEGLVLVHTILETLKISQVNAQQSRVQLKRSESGRRTNLVKLHED
jgi:hypothetical protein